VYALNRSLKLLDVLHDMYLIFLRETQMYYIFLLVYFLKCFGVPGGQIEQMQSLVKDGDGEVRNSVLTRV
jgi:hypothetical protein